MPTRLAEERAIVESEARPGCLRRHLRYVLSRVYLYAYKRLRSHEDAEDVASETFTLAFEALPRYEWRNVPFGAWLFRIASNQVAMHFRKAQPAQSINDVVVADPDADPQTETIRRSQADEVRTAVRTLKLDQQRAVELRYNQCMRAREIAAAMGKTEGSVKLLLHRATVSLRSVFLPLSA
ncbi:MAG: sigma-70 family RNA polymerase sigma factor [Chloroflexia bacterium]